MFNRFENGSKYLIRLKPKLKLIYKKKKKTTAVEAVGRKKFE